MCGGSEQCVQVRVSVSIQCEHLRGMCEITVRECPSANLSPDSYVDIDSCCLSLSAILSPRAFTFSAQFT